MSQDDWSHRESYTFDRATIAEIQRAANTGIYRIRGWGAKRALPTFDDLVFLGASMSRYTRSRVTARPVTRRSRWGRATRPSRSSSRFPSPSPA